MSDQKSFFYLKDITRLIQEATNVGGEELASSFIHQQQKMKNQN